MAEKFKYGPLVWNHVDEEHDSGNYWWSGLPPVNYDDAWVYLLMKKDFNVYL
jgi:hypothetical protein